MKKFIALTMFSLSVTSFAATQADLVLQGSVAEILEISIAPETDASSLPLDYATTPSVTTLLVGKVTEKSNHATGYKVKAVSTNNGYLAHESDATSSVDYHLYYDGSEIVFNGTTAVEVYSTSTQKGSFTKNLSVSYNVPQDLSAGNYEDQVQFTIEAN